jgi:two-component system, NtrC family, response regulator AtoC
MKLPSVPSGIVQFQQSLTYLKNSGYVVSSLQPVVEAQMDGGAGGQSGHSPLVPAELVLRDPAMQRLYAMLEVLGPTTLSVLLVGETGVGKEVLADALVRRSTRSKASFIKLNCAALPESLLEAELFGVEKGAFTGATHSQTGLFEAAHGGTLFLDEVGDMSPSTQTKVLRALESGEVLRLGSPTARKVDVRFISASNHNLRELVAAGTFRVDLFFRLNGITLTLPPLRSRPTEILPLAKHFLEQASIELGRPPPQLSAEVEGLLQTHPWPGNVRELRNVVRRAAVLCCGASVLPEHLLMQEETKPVPVAASAEVGPDQATDQSPLRPAQAELKGRMDQFEREHVLAALAQTNGNQTRAAELLRIARRTLIKKMIRHGIERPRARSPVGR